MIYHRPTIISGSLDRFHGVATTWIYNTQIAGEHTPKKIQDILKNQTSKLHQVNFWRYEKPLFAANHFATGKPHRFPIAHPQHHDRQISMLLVPRQRKHPWCCWEPMFFLEKIAKYLFFKNGFDSFSTIFWEDNFFRTQDIKRFEAVLQDASGCSTGFHSHGDTPIAGCFVSWNIPLAAASHAAMRLVHRLLHRTPMRRARRASGAQAEKRPEKTWAWIFQ